MTRFPPHQGSNRHAASSRQRDVFGRLPRLFHLDSIQIPMGRTLASKQQIVGELKELLAEAELALVLDYKGLSIKEMTDLRDRLRAGNGICKVTKNSLMRRAIDGDSTWASLDSLLTGTNAFVLIKGDVGAGVKAVQTFQKDIKKSETKGGLFEGRLLSQDEIKAIAALPSKEQLMAQIAGAINAVATKVAVGINEVPSGMARALKQHAENGES